MPKRSAFRDFTRDFMDLHRMLALAESWAFTAVQCETRGYRKRAETARRKCLYWLARCRTIELHYKPKVPK